MIYTLTMNMRRAMLISAMLIVALRSLYIQPDKSSSPSLKRLNNGEESVPYVVTSLKNKKIPSEKWKEN